MLAANPRSPEWLKFKSIQANANAANGIVALMTASEANLSREISFARVSGRDLSAMLQNLRILVARTSGFAFFHAVVEKHLHREESDAKGGPAADDLVLHLGRSRANSPAHTPASTRPSSPTRERQASSSTPDPAALGEALSRVRHESEHGTARGNGASSSPGYPSSPLSGVQPAPPRIGRAQSSPGLRTRDDSSTSLADLAEHPSATSSRDRDEHASVSIAHGAHPHHDAHSHHGAHGHYTRFPKDKRRRSRSRNRSGAHGHGHGHGKGSSSHISLPSLLHEVLHPQLDVKPVGVVESMVRLLMPSRRVNGADLCRRSQTYADLEDYLHNP